MTFVPAIVLLAQTPASPPSGVADTVIAGRAVAAYEFTPWRRLHPKADLALTFTKPPLAATQVGLIRTSLGCKEPMPVLDAAVLTIVFGATQRPAPNRLSIEAYVFLGSFPKGFRASYLVATDGKTPRVLSRTVLDKYEIAPPKAGI